LLTYSYIIDSGKAMEIIITKGKGTGQTRLSAFDDALHNAGIADFNLISISSIIPPGTRVIARKIKKRRRNFGDKLYVVLSKASQVDIGKESWAGIGWVQAKDGRGMFVEHTAESKTDVTRLIKKSLKDMMRYRSEQFSLPKYITSGMICKDLPVSAVVAAVYKSEGWD
jgi:arginine decarboxylase